MQVHGCSWRGHKCPEGRRPRTNKRYWNANQTGTSGGIICPVLSYLNLSTRHSCRGLANPKSDDKTCRAEAVLAGGQGPLPPSGQAGVTFKPQRSNRARPPRRGRYNSNPCSHYPRTSHFQPRACTVTSARGSTVFPPRATSGRFCSCFRWAGASNFTISS